MTVHSTPVGALEGDMQTCRSPETLPIEAGDVEWVADLFDTLRAGDIDAIVDRLDGAARLARKSAKARRMLGTVDPRLLSQGLALHRARVGASQ
jgi:hypothetical protein